MFCCESCPYQSNRKSYLQKHIKLKHKRDASDKELIEIQQILPETIEIHIENKNENEKNGTGYHKIYASASTKSRFLKTCEIREVKKIFATHTQTQTQTQTNNTNNICTNTNTISNITIHCYNYQIPYKHR